VPELNALIPWRELGYLVEALGDAWNNITRCRKKDVPTSGTKDSSAFVLINFKGESQDAKLPRGMKSLLEKKDVTPVVLPQYGVAILEEQAKPWGRERLGDPAVLSWSLGGGAVETLLDAKGASIRMTALY